MLLSLGGKGAAGEGVHYCLYYCKGHTLFLYYSLICVIHLTVFRDKYPPEGHMLPALTGMT